MTTTIELNEAVARKVLTVVDAGLCPGKGRPVPGHMCVEAAVCFALGLEHGDDPPCVGRAVRSAKIRLNDSRWSSASTRAKGLRRVAIAQLGSNGLDQQVFAARLATETIREIVPIALRAAAKFNPAYATTLEGCAVACEKKPTLANARFAKDVARVAADAAASAYAAASAAASAAAASAAAYAYDAAANAAYDDAAAAYDAAYTAAYAAYAAADAAYDASASASTAADADTAATNAASAAAAAAANAATNRDRILTQFADIIVRILTEMNCPGCQWLPLADEDPNLAQ